MSERREYTLPGGITLALLEDGEWTDDECRRGTLAEHLERAELHYHRQIEAGEEGLASVRRIRVEAGLGLLEWAFDSDGSAKAEAIGGLLQFRAYFGSNGWSAFSEDAADVYPISEREDSREGAQAACNAWLSAWLDRAGLQVRR